MFNIYMIDDNRFKQKWFLRILEKANDILTNNKSRITLKSGWGDDVTISTTKSMGINDVFKAVQDPIGIYLVDLDLQTDGTELKHLFLGSNIPSLIKSANKFDDITKKNDKLSIVAKKFSYSILILLSCIHSNKKSLFISTDAQSTYSDTVKDASLATVSLGSFPSDNPDDYTPSNDEVEKWARRLIGLIDSLDHIKSATSSWFSKGGDDWQSYSSDGLPHDLSCDHRISSGDLDAARQDYFNCVRTAFHWIPDGFSQWALNEAEWAAFHECLKETVGFHSSWMGIDDRDLCLGGAYLLLVTAVSEKFPNQVIPLLNIRWSDFLLDDDPMPFLPRQDHQDSARSVRAMYNFFRSIVENKETHKCSIIQIKSPEIGQCSFHAKISWSKEQAQGLTKKLRTKYINKAFEDEKIDLPKSNTTSLLILFLISSQINKSGVGSLGTISLEENINSIWLIVGSS